MDVGSYLFTRLLTLHGNINPRTKRNDSTALRPRLQLRTVSFFCSMPAWRRLAAQLRISQCSCTNVVDLTEVEMLCHSSQLILQYTYDVRQSV